MAAISACHKERDFPRALALLKHMRRKVTELSLTVALRAVGL